ncbi:MAG: hypothetical protein ABI889_00215 [Gemmatimonadota bacterium]
MLEPSVELDPVPVPLLMLDPLMPLVLELLVPPAAVPLMPPVVELPLMLPLLEPVLEPLRIPPILSDDAGATEPPAVAVSVVFALLRPLHAATAAAAARIAMRFMKFSEKNYP